MDSWTRSGSDVYERDAEISSTGDGCLYAKQKHKSDVKSDWSSASPPFWIWFNIMILFAIMDLFPSPWFYSHHDAFAVMIVFLDDCWCSAADYWSDLIAFVTIIREKDSQRRTFALVRFGHAECVQWMSHEWEVMKMMMMMLETQVTET